MTSPSTAGERAKAVKLAKQGCTLREIGEKLGYTRDTVGRWLRAAGVKAPNKLEFEEGWLEDNCDIYFGCASPEAISRLHMGRPSKDFLRRRRKALYPQIKVNRKCAKRIPGERWAKLKSIEDAWDMNYKLQQLLGYPRPQGLTEHLEELRE